MNWKIHPLIPSDAQEALELLKTLSDNGEVLYKPLEEEDFLKRFFGEKRWGFTARDENGRLGGWVHAAAKTVFLPGETEENTPLYLTMLLVSADYRRQGMGQALLDAVKALGEEIGKKSLVISGDNPVHLAWLIPGAGTRFFEYIHCLGSIMKSCARMNKPVAVLDRIAPLGGEIVEGTVCPPQMHTIVGDYELPSRFALTMGEFARYINGASSPPAVI